MPAPITLVIAGTKDTTPEELEWSQNLPKDTYQVNVMKDPSLPLSYLKYILENYQDLPEYVLFLQANPFQFTTLPKEKFLTTLREEPSILFDKTQWIQLLRANGQGFPHHPGLPIAEAFSKVFPSLKVPPVFEFSAGSQFMTTKARIQAHSKGFYEDLLKKIKAKEIDNFTIERLWFLILVHPVTLVAPTPTNNHPPM